MTTEPEYHANRPILIEATRSRFGLRRSRSVKAAS